MADVTLDIQCIHHLLKGNILVGQRLKGRIPNPVEERIEGVIWL